jgi:hypothetical protein
VEAAIYQRCSCSVDAYLREAPLRSLVSTTTTIAHHEYPRLFMECALAGMVALTMHSQCAALLAGGGVDTAAIIQVRGRSQSKLKFTCALALSMRGHCPCSCAQSGCFPEPIVMWHLGHQSASVAEPCL